jgi:hypothetical protein
MLVKVRNASFRRWVRPDQCVDIHAAILTNTTDVASASCRVTVAGNDVAGADLLFSFLPYSQLAEGYRDDVLERYFAGHAGRRAEPST